MFTIYASPLERIIRSFGVDCMIYADDTQLYLLFDSTNRDSQLQKLETCIRGIKAWTAENKLLLNDAKTEVLHISSRFLKELCPIPSVCVGQEDVVPSTQVRNLGAIMDQHMTSSSHVNRVCQSASLAIAKIGSIRKYIDRTTAERLVHAFVTSRLDANNSLMYGIPNASIKKLQRVQNSAVRLVLGVKGYHVNIDDLRRTKLHWLPVKDRIVFKILLLTYKSLNGLAPAYLSDLLSRYEPPRTLRSASQCLLNSPRDISTIYYGERAFATSAPKLWNALPLSIKNAPSVAVFKKLLKTHLFNNPTL